ncbi:MAG: protein kinase domain-containing protein [Myxococcota bacterium]
MSARKPSLKQGDLFQNQYRIERVLGSGGHAFVYAARDEIMGRDVALKLIEIPAESGNDRRRRACTEAQALRRVDHPNVVRVLSAHATDDGWIYIVMSLLSGPTLRKVLSEQRTLGIVEALEIAAQIADGTHAAHQANIIHRDLKPENVILEAGNKALIIDFGVAKLVDPDAQTTQRDLIQGTIQYLSPEQLRGQRASRQSDMFALGVIIYEMLTGTRPALVGLTEINIDVIAYRQLYEIPEPLPALRNDVPPSVDRLVQRMLDKDPAKRFQGMDEVATALRKQSTRLTASSPDAIQAARRALSLPPQQSPREQDRAVLATVSAERRTLVQTTQRLALVQVPPEALPTGTITATRTEQRSSQNAPRADDQSHPLTRIVHHVSTVSFETATPASMLAEVQAPPSEDLLDGAVPVTTASDEVTVAWWNLSSVASHPFWGRTLGVAAVAGTILGTLSGMLTPASAVTSRAGVAEARTVTSIEPSKAVPIASAMSEASFSISNAATSAPEQVTSAVIAAPPQTPPSSISAAALSNSVSSPAVPETRTLAPRRAKPRVAKPALSASAAPVASAHEPKSWIRVHRDEDWLPSSGLPDLVPVPARSAPAPSSARPRSVLVPARP